ncbi:MAG: histidinol-phosphate aminotransferase family protein [Chloroflexi bacterium]|nr:histidinol-phosphate aminotransferase family protein [Chloroflexota bacterium]
MPEDGGTTDHAGVSAGRPQLPAPRLRWMPPVAHGGPDFVELAALGIRPEALLDFSVNQNPLGASPRAQRAIALVDPAPYPDTRCVRLRSALATAHDVRADDILVGNGSIELLWLLAQTYLSTDDRVLIVGPTFGEYAAAAARQGAAVREVVASSGVEFRPDVDEICQTIRAMQPRLAFLCNPNNPTGQALDLADLKAILAACGETLLVVDEAYIDFAEGVTSALALRQDRRVVVVRSLTKSYGLAGLRLGYVVADPVVVDVLASAQPPWSVNAFAQTAGLAALGDEEHLTAGRRLARRARVSLVDGLERLGLPCVPSRTNFWLVEVGDGTTARTELLRRGILVRDATSFGLPRSIRLAARPLEECSRLLTVLTDLMTTGLLGPDVSG